VDNYRNIGITVKSPAVKTRYRLVVEQPLAFFAFCADIKACSWLINSPIPSGACDRKSIPHLGLLGNADKTV
jgi:hypothetical protein